MKLSDLVFDFIGSKGIDTVFTVSGGGCMHLTDSLSRNKNIKYICNHHEQACAMAAEGYARTANKPGCVLVTTGPGGTNTLTGVLCAYQDSIPLIIISGQVPSDQLSKGTGCRQIGQQEFNIIDTVKTMTKYSAVVIEKNDILYHLEKAYHLAVSGRPGPVWLDIPLDIQSSDVQFENLKKYEFPVNSSSNHNKAKKLVTKLNRLLKKSKKPIIVVGSGIRVSNTTNELKQFLEKTEIPVMSGPHSAVDVVNTDYSHYTGRFGILGQYTSNNIIQQSDLIISLGSRLNPKMIGYDSAKFAPEAIKYIVDVDNNEINKLKFDKKISCNMDLNNFFVFANQLVEKPKIQDWQEYCKNFRNKEKLVLGKHVDLKDYVSTYVFANSLEKFLKNDSIIVTSDGTAHVVPLKTMNLKGNQRLFSNEGTAPMGYGLPAAIGAYYGSNLPIICIEGDGSIMMNLQELETAKHNKIPMKIFILNNEGYLSIKLTQKSFFKGHLAASEISSGVSIPQFKKISEAFGLKYYSIKNNSEINDTLFDVFKTDELSLIEVFTDPNELHEPKVVAKGIDKDGKIIPGELSNMNLPKEMYS